MSDGVKCCGKTKHDQEEKKALDGVEYQLLLQIRQLYKGGDI